MDDEIQTRSTTRQEVNAGHGEHKRQSSVIDALPIFVRILAATPFREAQELADEYMYI